MIIRQAPNIDLDCGCLISEKIIRIIRKRGYDYTYAGWFRDNPADLYLRIIEDGGNMRVETFNTDW